ncbi:GDSL-type esterase/lipase family protein [Cellulosimicrobium sp. Marseille-Q4280]|uniref:GDSL-type esterase/lipase family protein n=1 Tax=Cellulosimicrobium sp. Marseille-Q4280 TaxID=2937992 RepID=UPI00203C94D7|nr:GDSL-type esterase/lipase family protein [Cellulosimicrobium sp. Marseille-Q4280]
MLGSDRDVRVCFVGDSYVAGVGDETALGWVGRVAAVSAMRGLPLTSYNLGVRRDTSADVAARVAGEVAPRLREATEPRVVVSFGVNDTVLDGGAPRLSVDETLAALDRVRVVVRDELDVPLLVVGPVAVADVEHDVRIGRLDDALAVETERLGIPYVPVFDATSRDEAWRHAVVAGDGYHPGANGYEILADLVVARVLDWVG